MIAPMPERHGGALHTMQARYPNAPQPWIDLSTGINPWPWPIPQNIREDTALLTRLPSGQQWGACRAAMAGAFNVDQKAILPVPGSASAIALLPQVLPAKQVAVQSPSYGDYERVWRAAGAEVSLLGNPLEAARDVDVICVCQPNNPNGRRFSHDALIGAAKDLATHGGYLVVDEAYVDLDPSLSLSTDLHLENVILLRSFGKFYGLAGVRLGAVISHANILEKLQALQGDWPVSSLALKVGALAYSDGNYAQETRLRLAKARARMDGLLKAAGIHICGGTDLFCFVQVHDSMSLFEHLAHSGIYVRAFEWSETHLRIGIPSSDGAEKRLAAALKSWEHP
jgi:cobalamin biosynthetic protein CobC